MKVLLRIVIGLVVLTVLIIGGGLAFLASLDADDIKTRLTEEVRKQTGHELNLEGPLEFAVWPKIRLKAGPLSLSNAAGFGDAPMLMAADLQVAVATLPLLSRRIEMDTVVLHGLRLNLARNAEGATNWDSFAGDAGAEKHRDSGGLAALILGGVDIKDAQLNWNDAVSGQSVQISRLDVTTGALTLGEPVAFELAMSAIANQPAFDGDVKLNGTVAYNIDDEHYVVTPLALTTEMRGQHLPGGHTTIALDAAIDLNLADATMSVSGLELSGLGTTATGEFKATHIDEAQPGAAGKLSVKGKDLAQIFSAFKLPVGKQIAAVADRAFDLEIAFDADMDSGEVVVSQFDGQLLGATLSGRFNASKANTAEPTAKGTLTAKGPDLPLLVAVIGTLNGASPGALKSLNTAFSDATDKAFSVNADLDADLGAGRVSLPKLTAELLGNSINGAVVVSNANTPEPAVKGTLKALGPDLPSLLAVVSGFQGDGKPLRDMARRLAGESDKRFDISADFDADLASGRIDVPTLSADLLGLSARGSMKGHEVDFAKGSGNLDGALKIESKDMGPLLRGLGQGDLAKSVRALIVDAGLKGELSNLQIAPLLVNATVLRPGSDKPVDLRIAAGAAHANLGQETLSLKDVTVTGLGLNARASLEAEKIQSAPTFSGTLDIPTFDLRALLATLNQPMPKTSDPTALTRLGLKSSFSGSTTNLALLDLNAVLDETSITGMLAIVNFTGPDVAFDIKVDSLNADRYLEPISPGEVRAATPEAAAAGAASELPVAQLRSLKVQGDLVVNDLTLSGARMKNVKFAIKGSGGRIKAEPLAAELYQGSYGGAITLDATGPAALLDINTRLTKVNVEPLLKDTVQNDSLSGIVSFDAALKATGGSGDRLKQSLGGSGTFNTTGGVFRGVDAVAVLRTVEQIIECKCPLPVPKGGETRFNTLGGTLNAQNGVIRNEDLVLAGDGFTITGKGMLANLHDNTLKYDLKLAVDAARTSTGNASYNLGGYTVPIQCRGKIDEPSCLPDLGDILKQVAVSAAKKKVEEALGKKLEDAVGGEAGDALKKLFKF